MNEVFVKRLGELIDGRYVAEFARKIGLSTETVRKYVLGRTPKGDFLYTICKATGESSDWLLGLSDVRSRSASPTSSSSSPPFFKGADAAEPKEPPYGKGCPVCNEKDLRISEMKAYIEHLERITDHLLNARERPGRKTYSVPPQPTR